MVTVAVLFLRLFPLLLSAFAWVARQVGGASMQMVLWHLTRAPVQPGRLALLLIMATSLGMFGGTFGATLDRSFDDRAAYESGAALRLADIRSGGASARMLEADLADAPGIAAMSQVVRANGSYTRGVLDVTDATVLGVDPESFRDVLWYRDDFAVDGIGSLLSRLEAPQVEVAELSVPAAARYIGVWIWLPNSRGALSPTIRVQNAEGRYRDVGLQGLPRGARGFGGAFREGWQFLVGDLRGGPRGGDEGPWQVLALGVRTPSFSSFSGDLVYDDIQYSVSEALPENWVQNGFDDGVIIEGFETQGRWTVFSDILREPWPDDARLDGSEVYSGASAMRYRWTRAIRSGVPRGVRLVGPESPAPVVASNAFLTEAGLEVGSEVKIGVANIFVPVVIVGSFDLFPTWDPAGGRSLLIADRDYLDYRVNRNPTSGGSLAPTEVWVRPTDEAGLQELRSYLELSPPWIHTPWDVEAIRQLQDEDPLVAAGWEGLLFITFIAIVLLSALGFLVASVLVAQQQQGEFAVLRTMGFSTRQVLIVVGLEKLLIIFVSMAIGTLLGLQLGVMMLEFVGFVETGEALLPPFVTVTDWATIGGAYGVLGLVFLGAIAIIVALYMRMAIGQILRIGTE